MRLRWMTILLLVTPGACSWLTDSRKYSVYFEPYSAGLNQQSRETIDAVASFAHDHPLQPIEIDGFSAPPDPKQDIDGLSAERAEAVKQALVTAGVAPIRITTAANGIIDPKNLPSVAVRRVDINVGHD
jgi:outer membrane protein OmpA-like peptidoglycan-associated protein